MLKIGDDISISGFTTVKLTDDWESTVNSFAQANGITAQKAEEVLSTLPELQDFQNNLVSPDVEDEIIITDDFVDDQTYITYNTNTSSNIDQSAVNNVSANIQMKAATSSTGALLNEGEWEESDTAPSDFNREQFLSALGLSSSSNISKYIYVNNEFYGIKIGDNIYSKPTNMATSASEDEKQNLIGWLQTYFPDDNIGDINNFYATKENGKKVYVVNTDKYNYRITFYSGLNVVEEVTKTDNTTDVSTKIHYGKDGLEDTEFLQWKEEFIEEIIKQGFSDSGKYSDYDRQKVREWVSDYIDVDYMEKGTFGKLIDLVCKKLSDQGGRYSQAAANLLTYIKNDPNGIGYKLLNYSEKIGLYRTDKNNSDPVIKSYQCNGLGFRVEYPKSQENNFKFSVSASGNDVNISAESCNIEVLGIGSFAGKINISGHNIEFNNNSVTASGVVNSADGSIINGSYGADTITNTSAAGGTTINAGLGDDKISNAANNVTINGNAGNDNITNTGSSTIINGNSGDDVISNSAHNVTMYGNDGNDTMINIGQTLGVNMYGGEGNDSYNYQKDYARVYDTQGTNINNSMGRGTTPSTTTTPTTETSRTFTTEGITYKVSVENAISSDEWDTIFTASWDSSINRLVLDTKKHCDIQVLSSTRSNCKIGLTGENNSDGINFSSNIAVTLSNRVNNSRITGSSYKDNITNFADNVVIDGKGGDDYLYNNGDNNSILDIDGANLVVNDKHAENTNILDDGENKIENNGQGTGVFQSETTNATGSVKYNLDATLAYLNFALNSLSNSSSSSSLSAEVATDIQNLIARLLTTDESGRQVFTEEALQLIAYAKTIQPNAANALDALRVSLNAADTSGNGSITEVELDAFLAQITSLRDGTYNSSGSNEEGNSGTTTSSAISISGNAAGNVADGTTASSVISNGALKTLGLTSSQISAFVKAQGSEENAVKLLQQLEVLYNEKLQIISDSDNAVKDTSRIIEQLKAIITNPTVNTLNDEILADAQLLIDAYNQYPDDETARNNYIKNSMITDGSSMDLSTMFSQTAVGELVEKDGLLYVNDGSQMVTLNISADTYLELFPPVQRYLIEQGSYGDCFFIATSMADMMENETSTAKLLQCFSEDTSGNLTVTFPGVSDYPVTFTRNSSGELVLKTTDNQYTVSGTNKTTQTTTVLTGSLGTQIMEQAYALAKFAQYSNKELTTEALEEYEITDDALIAALKEKNVSAANLDGQGSDDIDIDKALLWYAEGGYAAEAYQDVLGNGAQISNLSVSQSNLEKAWKKVKSDSSSGIVAMIGGGVSISSSDASKYQLISGHQYSIESVDTTNQIVNLKNPHDTYKVISVPYSVFLKYFTSITTVDY